MHSLVPLVSCPGSRKTKKIGDWCVLLLVNNYINLFWGGLLKSMLLDKPPPQYRVTRDKKRKKEEKRKRSCHDRDKMIRRNTVANCMFDRFLYGYGCSVYAENFFTEKVWRGKSGPPTSTKYKSKKPLQVGSAAFLARCQISLRVCMQRAKLYQQSSKDKIRNSENSLISTTQQRKVPARFCSVRWQ